MHIKYKYDILDETRGILVHSANAMGVMGAGLALQIRDKYPEVYKDYKALLEIDNSPNALGTCAVTRINNEFFIVTGIGQYYYGRVKNVVYTDYSAIERIFNDVNILALKTKLPVMFPKIGTGLGGGKWEIIESIIEETLDPTVQRTLYLI